MHATVVRVDDEFHVAAVVVAGDRQFLCVSQRHSMKVPLSKHGVDCNGGGNCVGCNSRGSSASDHGVACRVASPTLLVLSIQCIGIGFSLYSHVHGRDIFTVLQRCRSVSLWLHVCGCQAQNMKLTHFSRR